MLGGVGRRVNMDSPKNTRPSADAVDTADQFAVLPGLCGMGMAEPVQADIGAIISDGDPGPGKASARGSPQARITASKAWSKVIRETGPAQTLAQTARESSERGRNQHHARIRRPPQYGLSGLVPREDALPIGREQAFRLRLPPIASSPFGIGERARHGREIRRRSAHGIEQYRKATARPCPSCRARKGRGVRAHVIDIGVHRAVFSRPGNRR
jgi:hypothetical protein